MINTELSAKAKQIRRRIISLQYENHGYHIGSNLSCVEILTALYFAVLKIDHTNPKSLDQDKFIMSKGHAAASLYATLEAVGIIDTDVLATYGKNGSKLAFHPISGSAPTINVSTGTLGHGLGIGIGMALAMARKHQTHKVYVLLSDGECDEGSTWEAALFAGHHHLSNLTAIIDNNHMQALGKTEDILNLEPLLSKWQAFGWQAVEIDGHDIDSLLAELKSPSKSNQPKLLVARTVKGKGVSFMEDQLLWHYKTLDANSYQQAMKELV